MLRSTAIAAMFGIGLQNDAYRIGMALPDFVFMLIAGGGLSSAFIPVFAEFWHTDRRKEAWKAFSVIVTVCSIISVVIVSAVWVGAPNLVHFWGEGKDPSAFPIATTISRIVLPAQYAFLIGSVLLATLYARKQFLGPAIAPNIYNVGIILGALYLGHILDPGIYGVAWGALVGALIGNLALPILFLIKSGAKFRFSTDLRAPGVKTFFVLLLPVILGFSLPSMVRIITQKFASHYGIGANTVMDSANELMQAPLGIFGQSLALAVFPVLAQFFAQGRMDAFRNQISRTLRTVIYLAMPSSVLMFVMAERIVSVIYGYGKAAHSGQLHSIAYGLQIYSVAIFAWCMQPVLMRGFFSLKKTYKPIILSTSMTALFILMCWISSMNLQWGFGAILWSSNIAALVLVVILFVALEKEIGKLDRPKIYATLLLSTLAAAIMGAVTYGAMMLWTPQSKTGTILDVILVCTVSAWAYYFVTEKFAMPETEYFSRAMRKLHLKR